MKITFNIENEEQLTALEISLYISKKQAFDDWLYRETSSNIKINRKIMQAYTSVYYQLYKYDIPCIIRPKIKGISKNKYTVRNVH